MTEAITVRTVVHAPLPKVWEFWTKPEHISNWAFASDDWEAPTTENDVRVGGKFKTRMQSKDGKEGFDFMGTYTAVTEHSVIEYDMDDLRHVKIEFKTAPDGVEIVETFDPENENPLDVQKNGWQAILDSFKKYVESKIKN